MRLYRTGDVGEPVRDIQDRLSALGFTSGDPPGRYSHGTETAVRTFQQDKGLTPDGIVGPDTWRAMVAAGYRLGDRSLYYRVPMMRGDDVAELQRRLNSIGFDAGKVDGIFGPDTLRAVLDFQHNRSMPEDGIAGREVGDELQLIARATTKAGRDEVRERQWLRDLPPVVTGQRVYVDAFCRDPDEATATWRAAITLGMILQDLGAHPLQSRSSDTFPPERVRAQRANRLGADFVVSFAIPRTDDVAAVLYFASPHSHSTGGKALANAIAEALAVPTRGRAVPMLKDTRAPAVIVLHTPMDEHTGGKAAQGILRLFATPTDERAAQEAQTVVG